jgi:hypothetical protein
MTEPAVFFVFIRKKLHYMFMGSYGKHAVLRAFRGQDGVALPVEAEPVEPLGVISVPVETLSVKTIAVVSFLVVFIVVEPIVDHSVKKTHVSAPFKKKATLKSQYGLIGLQRRYVTRMGGATG